MSGESWRVVVEIATVVCGPIAALVTVYQFWLNRSDRIADKLEKKKWRVEYAALLRRRSLRTDSYRRSLEARGAGWDRFFGPRLIGWEAFSGCLRIAFAYPLLLFIIAYVLSGARGIGGIGMFAEAQWWGELALRAGALALTAGAFLLWLRFVTDGENGLLPWLKRRLPAGSKWSSGWHGGFVSRLAEFLSFLIAATLAEVAAGTGPEIVAIALALAVIASGVIIVATFGALSVLILAIADLTAASDAGASGAVLLIFFVLLPLLNAVVDMMSWAITRWFVRQAARLGLTVRVFFEALLDIGLAFLCLILLAAILPNAIALANLVLPEPGVDWDERAAQAVRDPFGAGFMVSGMLLTTLVPTAIHLWDGLRGVLVAPFKGHPEIAERLEAWPGRKGFNDLDLEARAVIAIRVVTLRNLVVGLIAAVMIAALGAAVFHIPGSPGLFLYDVALCATWWQGQSCAPLLTFLGVVP
ncbi:MAG: hypothetical protein AAFR17_03315 [Pseudomonadota bacterium]